MKKTVYEVGQVNHYIKGMFAQDILLNSLYVRGEVSNLKYHTSGHIYFSLKDKSGTLSCVMWRGDRRGLAFPMKDGDKVIVGGSVNIYEVAGNYQLYAKSIELEGAGLLYEQFLKLKKELEEMGMFSSIYKKPIPQYAFRVGVVTAPTGAAVRDIQNISHRRNPYVQLILYPAIVQGKEAAASIVKGIQLLDKMNLDVLIVGRGGGSLEDLWAFNEEEVARAVFECKTPVISAVGHETDTTIIDYVSDLRAPTPSAAAELAIFDYRQFEEQLSIRKATLSASLGRRLLNLKHASERCQLKLNLLSPKNKLNTQRQKTADLEEALKNAMTEKLEKTKEESADLSDTLNRLFKQKMDDRKHYLQILIERFKGRNPLERLKTGYSYVETSGRKALKSVSQVKVGEELLIHTIDGTIESRVTKVDKTR